MATGPKHKMTKEERAKQFMPFAALKGFEKALHQKEKVIQERADLSEEQSEKIDWILRHLHEHDTVSVEYYEDGEYIIQTGKVTKMDAEKKMLEIGEIEVPFRDIRDVYF